ncbi:MAG TPA: hypothetical protein VF618_01005 [Thermoanaerobaculia bacterium]
MILYYAIGGGLGHVTRARRVLTALGLEGTIATSSDDAARVAGPFPVLRIPRSLEGDRNAHRAWLASQPCSRLIVDTFPCGLQGELADVTVPVDYVARLLRWEEYRRAVPYDLPRFDTMYVVEPITHTVESQHVVHLDLTADAPEPASREDAYWLIVHSGPANEVEELIAYTRDLQTVERDRTPVLVATATEPALPPNFHRVEAFPATPLFAEATRIISAAGFNVMLETERWRTKHHVLPFPRRFDDQFARAARRGER